MITLKERYICRVDASNADDSLQSLFGKKKDGADGLTDEERVQQADELLKGMSPEQIKNAIEP